MKKEFYEFSLELEDVTMPAFEERVIQPLVRSASAEEKEDDHHSQSEIQLAFFHPQFLWASSAPSDTNNYSDTSNLDSAQSSEDVTALDFEKRAPYPTINLLRARTVRSYANQVRENCNHSFLYHYTILVCLLVCLLASYYYTHCRNASHF